MKPKTKKTMIWAAAIVAIGVIAWLLFFRKKRTTAIIDRLDIDDFQKAALKAKVAEIEANEANNAGWTRASIEAKAAENGYTSEQWLVVEAAYALYYTSNWDLYERIGTMAKTL